MSKTQSLKFRWILALVVLAIVAMPLISGQEADNPPLDAAKKQAIVDEVSKLLEENYIFPETSKKLEAHIQDAPQERRL